MSIHVDRPSSAQTKPENQALKRVALAGCALLLVVALACSVGSGLGFFIGRITESGVPNLLAAPNVEIRSPAEPATDQALSPQDMEIFWEAMDLLEQYFYGALPSPKERSYGAIHGVLHLLDVPDRPLTLEESLASSIGSGFGFFIGRVNEFGLPEHPATAAEEETANTRTLSPEDMDIFWEVMKLMEQYPYADLPSPKERSYGAIHGVLHLLDDPNTSFLPPEEATNFLESMKGSFEGIGALVEWAEEQRAVLIIEPFTDQPAWNAGIRRNDLIIAIDGETVADMSGLSEAINKIKGPRGTDVRLTIQRPEREDAFDLIVTRNVIQIPIISSDVYGENGEIAYVSLTRFSDNAGRKLRAELETLLEDDPQGLIFDLRWNPGGLLQEAVNVTSIFLEDEDVLLERFSDGTEKIYDTQGNSLVPHDLPLVVLVNQGSASASEIVTGALQDVGRGVFIGTTTFGKGSVQLPRQLTDDSLLRVTIARWFTPANRSIDGIGLEPDIVVEITDEQVEDEEDPQLDRAIELLLTGQ